jgi:predicted MFS family arabinose efflux permease
MLFKKENRTVLIIALVAIVNALGYGIIIPVLYSYSKKFGMTDFQNGLLFASFSLAQFLSTPIIGRMSDKYGRKPLLLISISGTALSFFTMAFAPNIFFLFFARILDGITAGNIPVAMAVISDSTTAENRAKGFGIIMGTFSFGFVLGPAIAALTVGLDPTYPFLVAGGISILAVVITALFLPETNKHIGEVRKGKLFDFKKMWHALFDPNVGMTLLITMFYFLAFACAIIYGFQPFTKNVLGLSDTENALLFVLFGTVGLVTQLFVVQRFAKRFGLQKSFRIAILLTMTSFLIMFFSKTLFLFVFASIILGLFNGMAQTLIPTILSQETDAKSQGTMMGLNASYQSIGFILGPILGGLLATVAIAYPFLAGAGFMALCLFLSFGVLRPGVKKESTF